MTGDHLYVQTTEYSLSFTPKPFTNNNKALCRLREIAKGRTTRAQQREPVTQIQQRPTHRSIVSIPKLRPTSGTVKRPNQRQHSNSIHKHRKWIVLSNTFLTMQQGGRTFQYQHRPAFIRVKKKISATRPKHSIMQQHSSTIQ